MNEFPLEHFVHSLPAILLRVANDEHYTLKFASAEAARMLGYDPREFFENRNYTAASVVHPLDLDLLEKLDEVQATTGRTLIARYRLIDAKGNEVPVLDVSRPQFDADGRCQAFHSVIIDLRDAPQLQGPSGQVSRSP
jgi:PAS domain-containing protein